MTPQLQRFHQRVERDLGQLRSGKAPSPEPFLFYLLGYIEGFHEAEGITDLESAQLIQRAHMASAAGTTHSKATTGVTAMGQTADNLEMCSVSTFAAMCGASIDDVIAWANNGTIPSVKVSDFRMINIAKIKADLDGGKGSFNEGDYDDE